MRPFHPGVFIGVVVGLIVFAFALWTIKLWGSK
jgi:hypothetical protein